LTVRNIGVTRDILADSPSITGDLSVGDDLTVGGTDISFPNLPTSDPEVEGQLWNSSGTLTVSAG